MTLSCPDQPVVLGHRTRTRFRLHARCFSASLFNDKRLQTRQGRGYGVAISLSSSVGLTPSQFRYAQRTLLTELGSILSGYTAAPFDAATGIGLPISSVRNAKGLVERGGDEIGGIGTLPGFGAPHEATVHIFDGKRFVSLSPIAGPCGASEGAIMVSPDSSGRVIGIRAMAAARQAWKRPLSREV